MLRDTIDVEGQYEEILNQTLGAEKARELLAAQEGQQYTKFEMLDEERVNSFVRVMTHLQAEGVQVEDSKYTLGCLVNELADAPAGQGAESRAAQSLLDNKDGIAATLKYLVSNEEALDGAQAEFVQKLIGPAPNQVDPVYKLSRMSMAELTQAYDHLRSILHDREQVIQDRIKASLRHYRKDERVIFESRDFSREQEHLPDVLRNVLRYDYHALDQILGINEQVQHLQEVHKTPPHVKLYRWITSTMHISGPRSWSDNALTYARTDEHDALRHQPYRDDVSRSVTRAQGQPMRPWFEETQAEILKEHDRAQSEYQTPFDQLY